MSAPSRPKPRTFPRRRRADVPAITIGTEPCKELDRLPFGPAQAFDVHPVWPRPDGKIYLAEVDRAVATAYAEAHNDRRGRPTKLVMHSAGACERTARPIPHTPLRGTP